VPRPTRALTVATKPISNLASASPIFKLVSKGLKHGAHLPGYLGLGFSLANLFLNKKETNQKKPTENSTTDTPKTSAETANSQNNSLVSQPLANCSFQGKLTKQADTQPTLSLTAEIGNSSEQPVASLPKEAKSLPTKKSKEKKKKLRTAKSFFLAQPKKAKRTANSFSPSALRAALGKFTSLADKQSKG